MSTTLDEIALKKAALLYTTESQRLKIAVSYATLERPARVVTRVGSFLANPFVLVGIGLCALRLPWRGFSRMTRLAWKGWKWIRIAKTIAQFVPR